MWRRTTRWTLVLAWLISLGAAVYLAANTRLLAPALARLATRNLLRHQEGSIRLRDFRGNPFADLELHQVSVSLVDRSGGIVVIAVDTLRLGYRLRELWRDPPHLRRLEARGLRVHAAPGQDQEAAPPSSATVGWRPPRVRIDEVVIADGAFEMTDGAARLRERAPLIALRGGIAVQDSGLVLRLLAGDIDWRSRQSRLGALRGELRADPGGLVVRGLTGRVNEAAVAVDGRRAWDGTLSLLVSARGTSAGEIEELIDTRLGFAARGDLDAAIDVRPDTVRFDGLFDGILEGYRLEQVRGRGVITPQAAVWPELAGRVNGAWFHGTGRFDLRDPAAASFVLSGEVADVDLAQGLVPEVDLPASDGHGRVAIRRVEAEDQTLVTGWLARGHLAGIPFDSCWAEVEARGGIADIRRLDLRHRGQRAVLTGQADTTGVFDGRLALESRDLSGLPSSWGLPALRGRLQSEGIVSGRDPQYAFAGEVTLHQAGLGPMAVDSLRADLTVTDVLGAPTIEVVAGGAGLELGGVPLGRFRFAGGASAQAARLDSLSSARGDSTLLLRGRAVLDERGSAFTVDELRIALEGVDWRLDGPLDFAITPTSFDLDACRLSSAYGSLRAEGFADRRRGELDGLVVLERFDLRLLNPFAPPDWDLNGDLSAAIGLSGTTDVPLIAVSADLTGSVFPLARVDSLHVSATFAADTLVVGRLDLLTPYGRVGASGQVASPGAGRAADFWPRARLDLDLRIQNGDWAFLDQFAIPALDRLSGRLDGAFHVGGSAPDPVITGSLSSAPFNIHWLHLERLAGAVEVTRDRLTLAELEGHQGNLQLQGRLEVPLVFDLLSEPLSPPDGPFLLSVVIPPESDLAPLAQATNAFVETGGRGGLAMIASGPADHPRYDGELWVRDGYCVLRGLEEVYQQVSATGSWQGDHLRVRDIHGREGARGVFAGEGLLTFRGLQLEGFDVRLAVDRFLVASIPELRALVRSPEVRLRGVKVGPDSLMVPKFSGRLEIIEARYTGDFSEKPAVSDPRVATVAPDWLADLHLVGPPRTTLISNRAMELAMSGDVDVVRDLDGLYLRGSMNIDSGRLPVFNNDFRVASGRLDFSREVGVVPRVDLAAETTVRVRSENPYAGRTLERITVLVTGNLDRPSVDFRSESGYGRANIERMLLGLSPHAGDPQAAGGLRDASIAAGFNLLEREIASELNLVDTFDIESGRTLATGTTSTLIGVGKYLGQDLYVRYAQGLSQAERDLLIEYQISDHLLLQSGMSRRLDVWQGATTYNLDLKYRIEY